MLSTETVLYQDKGETEKTASVHSRLRSPAVCCRDQHLDLSYTLHLPLDQNSRPCWLINQKPFAVSFILSFFNSGGQKTPCPASLATRNGYMFHSWPRSYKRKFHKDFWDSFSFLTTGNMSLSTLPTVSKTSLRTKSQCCRWLCRKIEPGLWWHHWLVNQSQKALAFF